ncbi:MAG: MarR family transcriptional regulator [Chitinivibrionales bacterium]|nr:MarR family transcriptional regulator [Chitinivibrionales bacterium]
MNTKKLTSNLEDYLETIFSIVSTHEVARSMEIAEHLGVKRSSVTVALRSLAEKGLINYTPRSYITLTEKGRDAAQCIDRRHHILQDVFMKLFDLPESDANDAACKMEHGMTPKVCRKLASLCAVMENNPGLSETLKKKIAYYSKKIDCTSTCGYPINEEHDEH